MNPGLLVEKHKRNLCALHSPDTNPDKKFLGIQRIPPPETQIQKTKVHILLC